MCGVGSHICSDVSSVYLSVPSLSGGGLREGNALSGSNIKYIKWERMAHWSAGDVCVDFYWCRCLDRTENLHFQI